MKYIMMNQGLNRAERRKSTHEHMASISVVAKKNSVKRMHRPAKMDIIQSGFEKLTNFFGIRP